MLPAHLAIALLEQDGVAAALLAATASPDAVTACASRLRTQLAALRPRRPAPPSPRPQLSRPALAALTAARTASEAHGDAFVSADHLLVGLASVEGPESVAPAPGPRRRHA